MANNYYILMKVYIKNIDMIHVSVIKAYAYFKQNTEYCIYYF